MNTNFYKNLASNTPFQFDRIYSNRWSMDKNAQYDRIQIGRYVFVEYGDYKEEEKYDDYKKEKVYIKIKPEIYTKPDGTSILEYHFLDGNGNKASKAWGQIQYELLEGKKSNIKFQGNILIGDIYYNVDDGAYYEVCEQELNGNLGSKYFSDLVFNKIEESSILAYNINKDAPNNYDSTIWQKVYKNGKEQYEQIATVDTPVLEIGLSEKALTPSSLPEVKIGFNAEKDNNYYELSLPASWDFQVAESIEGYSDESDENGKKLDIYYNKKGLDNISFIPFSSGWDNETNYYNRLEENQMIKVDQLDNNSKYYKKVENIIGTVKQEDMISYDNAKYSEIKFLGENEYLWGNIQKSPEEEKFYYWGETRFIDIDDISETVSDEDETNKIINPSNIIKYTFFKKHNSNNLVPFIFSSNDNLERIKELKTALEEGGVIQAITYAEVKKAKDTYNKNITYYNNNYEEITIVIQNESAPYWEKKDENSSYYKYHLADTYILNNVYDPNLKYYIEDENGEYQPVIFEDDWEPYSYYEEITSDYEKYPYEIYDGKYYILSMDNEKQNKIYYKKLIHSKDIKTINKISVETADRKEEVEGNDTQELSINLPAIGNAIAEIYDILYGKDRESFIYSDIENIESMYNKGESLYNTDKKSVIGLINTVYDTIGRMVIKPYPNDLQNPNNYTNITLNETLFEKEEDGKKYYYLIFKSVDENGKEKYDDEKFNSRSLYYLIAEMQSILGGSYDSFFNALDRIFDILGDKFITVINDTKKGQFYYELKHNTNFDFTTSEPPSNTSLNLFLDTDDNITLSLKSYIIDEAGHNTNEQINESLSIPRAYANKTVSNCPIGSFWYDTSDLP